MNLPRFLHRYGQFDHSNYEKNPFLHSNTCFPGDHRSPALYNGKTFVYHTSTTVSSNSEFIDCQNLIARALTVQNMQIHNTATCLKCNQDEIISNF